MQLQVTNMFNAKLVKEILQNEDKFISDLFARMPVSTGKTDQSNDTDITTGDPISKERLTTFSKAGTRARNFGELQNKLEELKSKKLDYKQKLLKKGLKNRIKKKTKREERLLHKKLIKTNQISTGPHTISADNAIGTAPKAPKPKPIFNSDGKMVFSKFDFSEIGAKKKVSKTDKDPKKILQQLEQKSEKLKMLEELGEKEKASEIKEKDAWKTALARSSGEKVKDDPRLLKKSIQKQEQRKKKSSKKWQNRLETVTKGLQEKQEKRQENIMKRKKDKKLNKLKKASKRGRVIAGF
ncbi:surfeit locus protein 6 homolog [Prorops nasuta]|uniref:surfeit locus protein 6 homolog n=1 Tax=Prorops nasuta TaxID=863751 RepID=UPI0034CFFD02